MAYIQHHIHCKHKFTLQLTTGVATGQLLGSSIVATILGRLSMSLVELLSLQWTLEPSLSLHLVCTALFQALGSSNTTQLCGWLVGLFWFLVDRVICNLYGFCGAVFIISPRAVSGSHLPGQLVMNVLMSMYGAKVLRSRIWMPAHTFSQARSFAKKGSTVAEKLCTHTIHFCTLHTMVITQKFLSQGDWTRGRGCGSYPSPLQFLMRRSRQLVVKEPICTRVMAYIFCCMKRGYA